MTSTFFVRISPQQEIGVTWMPKHWVLKLIFGYILEMLDENTDNDLEECLEETIETGIGGVAELSAERFKRLTHKSTIAFWKLLYDANFQTKDDDGLKFVFLQLLILFYTDPRLNYRKRRGNIIIDNNLSWHNSWWITEVVLTFFAIQVKKPVHGAGLLNSNSPVIYDLRLIVSNKNTFCTLFTAVEYLIQYFKANPYIIAYTGIELFFLPAIINFQKCLSRHPHAQTCLGGSL